MPIDTMPTNLPDTDTNAWIAEHVMGFRKAKAIDEMGCSEFCVLDNGKVWVLTDHGYDEYAPYECQSDAMQVLEKCRERAIVLICSEDKTGKPMVGSVELRNFHEYKGYAVPDDGVIADTLPIAICRFARELFSK